MPTPALPENPFGVVGQAVKGPVAHSWHSRRTDPGGQDEPAEHVVP